MKSMKGEEDEIPWQRGPGGTEDLLLAEEASGEETEKPGDVGDSQ